MQANKRTSDSATRWEKFLSNAQRGRFIKL
jgi:hypothetical protein